MKIKEKKYRRRVFMINEDTEPVLRIDRMDFRFILNDFAAYFTGGLFVAVIVFFIAQSLMPLLPLFGICFLICIIALYLGFKSEKQIKPFYILFKEKSYKTWCEGKEAKAKKGKLTNIHVQFSDYKSIENTKTAKIKRNKTGEYIYEGTNFIKEDVALIREYFKKHKVERIS